MHYRYYPLLLALSLSGPLAANVDFTTQVNPIFSNAGCTSSFCHGGSSPPGGLALKSNDGGNYNRIVNVLSTTCGLDYVEPGDPSMSLIYQKISGTQSCGARMPKNNPDYFDSHTTELQTIQQWIAEGAPFEAVIAVDGASQTALPAGIALEQNYPNPFNPSTTIGYQLPHPAPVTLTVHDLLGRQVATLVAGVKPAGYHTAIWDGSTDQGAAVGSGVYLYRLQAGDHRQVRRMFYLK